MTVHRPKKIRLLEPRLIREALAQSVVKLSPAHMIRNPVMFVVEVCAAFVTGLFVASLTGRAGASVVVVGQICLWLWFTILFANFAEAIAEGRGKARADSLRSTQTESQAKRLERVGSSDYELVPSPQLKKGDLVLVEAGDTIPNDGEVVAGIASVDESAITGESAPVIRESGGDRSSVTGGTRVVSDAITVRITTNPGEAFLDKMIGLVEGANRQKTPNEIALNILLAGLSLIFVIVVVGLDAFAR